VGLAVDPHSGKAYVATFLDNGTTWPTTVWRIKNDGLLDSAYGGGGTAHVTYDQRRPQSLLALSGGLLLMAGTDWVGEAYAAAENVSVARSGAASATRALGSTRDRLRAEGSEGRAPFRGYSGKTAASSTTRRSVTAADRTFRTALMPTGVR
jgi:hypothetical protein